MPRPGALQLFGDRQMWGPGAVHSPTRGTWCGSRLGPRGGTALRQCRLPSIHSFRHSVIRSWIRSVADWLLSTCCVSRNRKHKGQGDSPTPPFWASGVGRGMPPRGVGLPCGPSQNASERGRPLLREGPVQGPHCPTVTHPGGHWGPCSLRPPTQLCIRAAPTYTTRVASGKSPTFLCLGFPTCDMWCLCLPRGRWPVTSRQHGLGEHSATTQAGTVGPLLSPPTPVFPGTWPFSRLPSGCGHAVQRTTHRPYVRL